MSADPTIVSVSYTAREVDLLARRMEGVRLLLSAAQWQDSFERQWLAALVAECPDHVPAYIRALFEAPAAQGRLE